MQNQAIIDLAQYRTMKEVPNKNKATTKTHKGSIYSRSKKLWVDFRYLGKRVREPSGLSDTQANRKTLRKQLDLVIAEIDNGVFVFATRFPHSKRKEHFAKLEGKRITKEPEDIFFGEYSAGWFEEMRFGMSDAQVQDYKTILNKHLLPYFAHLSFQEINKVRIKKFIAHMKGKKNPQGNPLSAKRILNIMIPLRVIVRDGIDEHGWTTIPDPFNRCKLPRPRKYRVQPFNFDEWNTLMEHISEWYRPYFELSVQTGLRPSEQVALKWNAIDSEYIHIELSRVGNQEKNDLKTHGSTRMISIRPTLARILQKQKELTKGIRSPYVFVNNFGEPVQQNTLRELFLRALKRASLPDRRMYETRHTFASWALALGETPEWVARTLGHVDTSMVYRTYGRYIPNLTKMDGSALERQFTGSGNKKGN